MINLTVSLGDGYIKSNGEATVYVIARVQRKKIKFNTGISILPEDWDTESNRIRGSSSQVKDYNLVISSVISRLNEIFVKYRLQNRELTPNLLRKEYKTPTSFTDFHSFMKSAINERKGELTESSIKQHHATLSKLKEYAPVLHFSEIDEEFIKKFNRWMINKKKNSQNTRHNAFKNLKAYMNIAVERKLMESNPLKKLPVNRTNVDPVWLSEDEISSLVTLYKKKFLPPSHQKALRHFLFSCMTGLRISDVKRVQMEDIIGNRLVIIPEKTRNRNAKTVKIPLTGFARQLIKDESPHRVRGNIFEMFSEYRTNVFLKEIMPVAKINKKVSFHTARHSFASYFLKRTKNIKALQELLGHSRLSETMIYSHILAEELDNEMDIAFGDISV